METGSGRSRTAGDWTMRPIVYHKHRPVDMRTIMALALKEPEREEAYRLWTLFSCIHLGHGDDLFSGMVARNFVNR